MAEQKDWSSTSLLKTTKFTTKAEQSPPKWTRNLKKDTLLQKTKRRTYQEVGGVNTWYKPKIIQNAATCLEDGMKMTEQKDWSSTSLLKATKFTTKY